MAVPSVSCTYSWPVWTEEHTVGAPAALTHTYLLYACGPRASAWPPFQPAKYTSSSVVGTNWMSKEKHDGSHRVP